MRGLEKARGEWSLVTMAWNIKRMFRPQPGLRRKPVRPNAPQHRPGDSGSGQSHRALGRQNDRSKAANPPRPTNPRPQSDRLLDDTVQNVPGGLDLRHFDAALSDLVSDVTGAIQLAADAMAWRVA